MPASVTPAPRAFRAEDFVPRHVNSLRGFVKVTLPSGMVLHDVAIHIASGRAWAMPAGKPMLDRDGAAMREAAGKVRYLPVVSFTAKEVRDRFSNAVIEAMRLAYPDELAAIADQGGSP